MTDPTPTVGRSPRFRLRQAVALPLIGAALLTASAGAAAAQAWAVECSDGLYCTATTEGVAPDGRRTLFKLERSADPDGPVFVTTGPDTPLSVGMRVEIDVHGLAEPFGVWGEVDRVYPGNEMTFGGAARRALVERLRAGTSATVTVFFGGNVGTVPYNVTLAGLTLALLEIDRRQDRLDRVDAIVAWGGLPADGGGAREDRAFSTAPPMQTDERIVYEVDELAAPVVEIGRGLGCDLEGAIPAFGATIIDFDVGSTLFLVSCHSADVNVASYVVLARDGAGTDASIVSFAPLPPDGTEPSETIVSPVWNAAIGAITATTYDSPSYDCGGFEVHAIDLSTGETRLLEYRAKTECDGEVVDPDKFPLVFEADR